MNNEQLSLREKISFYLEDMQSPLGRRINLTILGLIFLSSVIFAAETFSVLESLNTWFYYCDIMILILFTIEYLIRFLCAESKLKFLFSFFSIIDLLAIIPLFISVIDIRFIRLFRWFRIIRMIRFIEVEISIFKIKTADGIILTRIFLTLFAIIFIYSGLIYQVENPKNPASFRNFFDALYFSIVTMATVGFGDVTPLSDLGKLVTLMMILTGISFLPLQIGELTKQLVKSARQVQTKCSNCGLSVHDFDANFCKNCGTKLNEKLTFND